jgi:hypothetical protein
MNQANNVIQFPVSYSKQYKNRLGKQAVPCQVSDRWLRFNETSTVAPAGEFLVLDVMTGSVDTGSRKLCQVVFTRDALLEALSSVRPAQPESEKPSDNRESVFEWPVRDLRVE